MKFGASDGFETLLIGAVTAVTASQKAGMAVLVVFFVTGMVLLMMVREEPSIRRPGERRDP